MGFARSGTATGTAVLIERVDGARLACCLSHPVYVARLPGAANHKP
jgi:hypothetical protein